MGFDGVDKTDRFIIAARRRAEAALRETSPKLTALEKAMWLKLKRGERPCKTAKRAPKQEVHVLGTDVAEGDGLGACGELTPKQPSMSSELHSLRSIK